VISGEVVPVIETKKTTQSPQVWAVFVITYSQNLLRPTATLYHTCAKQQALKKGYMQATLTFGASGI
jgi:hypothetical protein